MVNNSPRRNKTIKYWMVLLPIFLFLFIALCLLSTSLFGNKPTVKQVPIPLHALENADYGIDKDRKPVAPVEFRIIADRIRDHEVDPDELLGFCREHLASYKLPRSVTVCDSFPKTATGKVMKWKLKATL